MPSSLRCGDPTHTSPNAQQRYWLTRTGSLSEALRQLGEFSLTVVSEGSSTADIEDAALLNVAAGSTLWTRDVLLHVDHQPLVYAHSLTLLDNTLPGGEWAQLRVQGQQPLATLLYSDPHIERQPFQWRQVYIAAPSSAHHQLPEQRSAQWARHSCFLKRRRPLVIAEAFLNAFWEHPRLEIAR